MQTLAAPLLSQSVTLDDIQKVVNGITRCYVLGNYATSKAYLPPQDVSNGVLQINLFEGTIGKVEVKNNRWTKKGYKKVLEFIKDNKVLRIDIICIVHGVGSGIIKNEVHTTLRKNKDVVDFKLFYNNTGWTIVKLKFDTNK